MGTNSKKLGDKVKPYSLLLNGLLWAEEDL
jgi:hypothetical protein